MKITCHSCGAKYAIADEKVRGRRVKVRCKGCKTAIVVDGYSMDSDDGGGSLEDDDATRVQQSAADLGGGAPADPNAWSVNLSDTDQRNMTTAEIVESWHSGQMPEDAFVWKEGMDDWLPIGDVPELVSAISAGAGGAPSQPPQQPYPSQPPPPSQPPAADAGGSFGSDFNFGGGGGQPEAARVEASRAQAGVDLFGAAAAAGSEAEARPAAPAASAYEDDKMTGARNENSVLFSLDALKAGMTPSAQSAPVAPSGGGDDKASMDDLMGGVGALGGGNALFGMQQNQSLLTAPAPPPPPKARPVVPSDPGLGASASIAPSMPPPKSNKLVFILGGAVAFLVLIVVILGVSFMGGSDEEDKLAKAEAAAAEKKKAEEKAAEEKKKAEEAAAAAAAKKKAEANKPPELPDGASADEKKRFQAAMAKLTALDKERPTEHKPTQAQAEDPKPGSEKFNTKAAISALRAASSASAACKKPGGPTGKGKAIVTFAPTGRVTATKVKDEFDGTSVGVCVATVFRAPRIPPFGGDAKTVAKSFTIPD